MNLSTGVRAGPPADEIKGLFSSIARTYDTANDVITFGIARRWRQALVQWASVDAPPASVLDCATGTGDLALAFKQTFADARVVGCDFCEPMLAIARTKARNIKFEIADVTALPYPDHEFSVASIAYGIRNVSDVPRALREMARVTKSGGSVMILETGVVENTALRFWVRLYFEKMVPRLGGLVSGQRGAYEYLQQSSGQFPSGAAFCDLLRATQLFASVEYRPLMGGASYLYRAVVA